MVLPHHRRRARRNTIASSSDIPSGLVFADTDAPGISRKKLTNGWGYHRDGKRISDQKEVTRLNALALPPAYERCWFCCDPRGHIQAIGYDARGRRQYRYHPDFRSNRDMEKFGRLEDFGRALPALRKALDSDLARSVHDKTTMAAAVVRLLDIAQLRIGGQNYARDNGSFGATTLRKRHAKVTGRTLRLRFKAKSGKDADYVLSDRILARIVKRCQDLPGQSLFAYPDDDGTMHPVSSHDVNDYLKAATKGDFTAKDFRTWGGTLIAYEALREADGEPLTLKAMLAKVSQALCNTPAVARKSYIHPVLMEAAKSGEPIDFPDVRATARLSRNERSLIEFLAQAG
jgi:DNA topoisomerase-1